MKVTISHLTSPDLNAVDGLMKRHRKMLGFLPREALRDYLEKGGILGAKTEDRQLVGYLLYANYPDRFRIGHLCVSESFRRQGIAKRLVDCLKKTATTKKVIRLRCRRDFSSHNMWPKLGFVALDDKPGRSMEGHPLTLWQFALSPDDQLGLFKVKTSDDTINIIIDAQIFFDFEEQGKPTPSTSLLSDFLTDSIEFHITDELLNEINRNNDSKQRKIHRERIENFIQVNPDPGLVEIFDTILRKILPSHSPSQESDIRQLAKAASSDVKIFVTRDQALLKKSKAIYDLTKLNVLSPTKLIIQLHELSERSSYNPSYISGLNLAWRRLTSEDIADAAFTSFLNQQPGDRRGVFRERLESFLANPEQYECELLWSGSDAIAIRVLSVAFDKILTVSLARAARSKDQSLFERFLVSDTISKAVMANLDMVKFEKTALASNLVPDLLETGFTPYQDGFVRFCFSRCLNRNQVSTAISEICPVLESNYHGMSNFELERHCSPLGLMEDTGQKHLLIPIRPSYAISLVDRHLSAEDLFGGEIKVLLRWEQVYYRNKTYHKMLKPPARLLWYVSGNQQKIVALSHLDEVDIGPLKEIYRRFRRFGILKWDDLYEMCEGDVSQEIMALKFSHTFPLRKPLSLDTIRTIYNEDNVGLSLQSPSVIPIETFQKMFRLGYSNQP